MSYMGNKKGKKLKMMTQIAATPTLYGEEAKKVIMEANTTPSEKAKENGEKLINYFEKFIKEA